MITARRHPPPSPSRCWSPATWVGTPPGGHSTSPSTSARRWSPCRSTSTTSRPPSGMPGPPACASSRSAAATAPRDSARSTTRCCCGRTRWRAWRSMRGRTALACGQAPAGPTSTDRASFLGLAPAGGFSRGGGVVGHVLGDGMGWLARRHGLAARGVTAVEVVTADGEIVRADRDPDLLEAPRRRRRDHRARARAAPRRRSLRRRALLRLRPRRRGHARVERVDRRRRPPRSPRSRA